ncbi:hypothetical protein SNK04_013864 [Fusarium graminearum]
MGWAGFVHQLAENCYAAVNGTKHPTWDPLNLDVSRLIKQEPPEDQKIDGPAPQNAILLTRSACLCSFTSQEQSSRAQSQGHSHRRNVDLDIRCLLSLYLAQPHAYSSARLQPRSEIDFILVRGD